MLFRSSAYPDELTKMAKSSKGKVSAAEPNLFEKLSDNWDLMNAHTFVWWEKLDECSVCKEKDKHYHCYNANESDGTYNVYKIAREKRENKKREDRGK